MIKYGEESHLRQIVEGKLRFAPSKDYIQMEEKLHSKGQGDALEGKMKIKASLKISDTETGVVLRSLPNCISTISFQNVNNFPVFCLSQYDCKSTTNYIDSAHYQIRLLPDDLKCVRTDFPKATHALIILEPNKFASNVQSINNHKIIGEEIHYYDNDTPEKYMYLATGDTRIRLKEALPIKKSDSYRILLCKNSCFVKQNEFRFIILDELIDSSVFYSYKFTSRYLIVPINKLSKTIDVSLGF